MKTTLFMAMSVNGMIARENGDEDFISHLDWDVFKKMAEKIGCFVVGRKTVDAVKKYEGFGFEDIDAKKIVVSSQKVEGFINADSPENAIIKAKAEGFDHLLLTGGGMLNAAFMKAGLIDEIIVSVQPFILGKGIRLFAEDDFESRLELVETKQLEEGIIELRYEVKK